MIRRVIRPLAQKKPILVTRLILLSAKYAKGLYMKSILCETITYFSIKVNLMYMEKLAWFMGTVVGEAVVPLRSLVVRGKYFVESWFLHSPIEICFNFGINWFQKTQFSALFSWIIDVKMELSKSKFWSAKVLIFKTCLELKEYFGQPIWCNALEAPLGFLKEEIFLSGHFLNFLF